MSIFYVETWDFLSNIEIFWMPKHYKYLFFKFIFLTTSTKKAFVSSFVQLQLRHASNKILWNTTSPLFVFPFYCKEEIMSVPGFCRTCWLCCPIRLKIIEIKFGNVFQSSVRVWEGEIKKKFTRPSLTIFVNTIYEK